MGKEDERWDIYDKNKQLTGRTMKRNDWTLKDDEYHLTVLGVVTRKSDGKYLVTKRSMDKAWAPGHWEVSGGAAMAGETSLEAVVREVQEETGLNITSDDCEYKFSYHRENPGQGDNYFVDIYKVAVEFTNEDVHAQEEETEGYMMVTLEQIKEIASRGEFLHYDSIKAVFE